MKRFSTFLIFLAACYIAHGQWQPTKGLYSGTVHSVIVSNGEIIAGAEKIYKSADNGLTWNVSNNGISGDVNFIRGLVKISTKLIAATNAGVYYSNDNGNNWTISAGTSNLNIFYLLAKGSILFLSTSSDGIYKSIDNGITWTSSSSGITTPYLEMRCIAVKGTDLYAGTDGRGIYKSINDGNTWTLVNTGLPGSYYSVSSLAVVNNNIIAGTYGAGIYKSTNNGTNWSAINNGISSSDDILAMGTNGNSIYASNLNGMLYKTTDYINWNAVSTGTYTATRFESFFSENGVFYIGSWGFGSPEKSYGIFKTTDDGNTWSHIGFTEFPVSTLEVSGSNILAGTYDVTGNSAHISFYRTTEADSVWYFNMGGLSTTNVTAIKSSGTTAYLFDYSGGGNSLLYRSVNNGLNWTSTGFNALYFKFNAMVFAGTMVYATSNYPSSSSHVFLSTDNGATWNGINNGLTSSVQSANSIVLKGTTLFIATNNGVYKNTVGQNNWTAVNSGLTNTNISSLIVSGNDIFAGTQGGGIFKTSNDGTLWTSVSTGLPLFANITCFASASSKIFTGTDQGVFMTVNSGANWTDVNTGLTDTYISAMTASTNYLWVGTYSHGVWKRGLSQFVSGVPPQPGQIYGNANVCSGTICTYYVTPVSGADNYTWSLPGVWTGTSTSNVITATAGLSGTISVTANNSFGSSSPQTLIVTVTQVNTSVSQSGMTLTANTSNATYKWLNCTTNQLVPGETGQSFTTQTEGYYAVIVTQNGCTDTSSCYLLSNNCTASISGNDLPYNGFTAIMSVDSIHSVTIGNAGIGQSWNYSGLVPQYVKFAEYHLTSSTPYSTVFPQSNLYTYGPGTFFSGLFGSVPIGSANNGYIFWKTDNTGHWMTGFRPDGGAYAGTNVQVSPPELLIASPAVYGDNFNNFSRWVFPVNLISANPDTFYVRRVNKTITADACGSLTTPYTFFPNVLRQHELLYTTDSVYIKVGTQTVYSMLFAKDTLNNYMYIAPEIGYPVCIIHATKNNTVKSVEYYSGNYTKIDDQNRNNKLLVYPNPTDGKLSVQYASPIGFYKIKLYNSLGEKVLEIKCNDNLTELDLRGLPKGLYLLEFISEHEQLSQKILLN